MDVAIRRLALVAMAAFVILALALGYWHVAAGPTVLRRDDNPRLVLAEQAVQRGTIFDRHGRPLAMSRFEDGMYVRHYPEPLAGPLVGYYSFRYGMAGAEASFDAILRGSQGQSPVQLWWNQALHRPQIGQDITLTLDLDWQQAAHQALSGQTGIVIVTDLHTGYILAVVSQPGFDPNRLDEDWDQLRADPSAPLFNRVLQGWYQPGSLFQTVVMEEALRQEIIALTQTVSLTGVLEKVVLSGEVRIDRDMSVTNIISAPLVISGTLIGCALPLAGQTWADIYAAGCPMPFVELAEQLDGSDLKAAIQRWQLDIPVGVWTEDRPRAMDKSVAVGTAQPDRWPGHQPLGRQSDRLSVRDVVLGQGVFTFTPLHALRMLATVADGCQPVALLVETNDPAGGTPLPSDQASYVKENKSQCLRSYGSPDLQGVSERSAQLHGVWQQQCGVRGLAGLAVSGADGLAWYMGMWSNGQLDQSPSRYGVVVLIESERPDWRSERQLGELPGSSGPATLLASPALETACRLVTRIEQ